MAADEATPVGVVGLTLGSPASPEQVLPFLEELFADRDMMRLPAQRWLGPFIARRRAPRARARYERIGGASPLMAISRRQVEGTCRVLGARGLEARPYLAARYLGPRAVDVVEQMARDGVERAVALPLYAQRSRVTTGSAMADLEAARARAGAGPQLRFAGSYCDLPSFVDALAATVREGLALLSEASREAAHLLFAAHSVPMKLVEAGDPYRGEVETTCAAVLARLGWQGGSSVAYQSRVGPVRWLGPDTGEEVARLARSGTRVLAVVPASFVSDHLETLYDLDLELAERARAEGIVEYVRCPAANDRPELLEALADVVETTLRA